MISHILVNTVSRGMVEIHGAHHVVRLVTVATSAARGYDGRERVDWGSCSWFP